MMKQNRRILSWLLVFIMMLGLIPTSVFASNDINTGAYDVDSNGMQVVANSITKSETTGDDKNGETKSATNTAESEINYELRVLTFEDSDYKGDTNYAGGKNWSALIDSSQYGGPLLYPTAANEAYNWYDKGNTELKHQFADEWGDHQYWGGGHAISNYVSADIEKYGGYDSQLTVYKKGITNLEQKGGGYNGSDNFAVHYGYADNSGYGGSILQTLTFGDGIARVIDHMYVTNVCYALNCYFNGNGLTANIGESDWVKLVATGFHGETQTGTAEIYLCNGPSTIVMDWTKWDLSVLGEITEVQFNVTGSSDNGYGFSQPAYFAYDNVAVRFPKDTVAESTTVTLDKEEASLKVGETVALIASVSPENATNKTVTWVSSDERVATVTDGMVTALAKGTAAITAKNGNHTATCQITVIDTTQPESDEVGQTCTEHIDKNSDKICDNCKANLNKKPVLKEGVLAEKRAVASIGYAYNVVELQKHTVFEDPDGDPLDYTSYYYEKSTDDGATWSEKQNFKPSAFGFTTIQFTETNPGTYLYRFYAWDGYEYSDDTYTIILTVSDEALQNYSFYVGRDQNYNDTSNPHYPVMKLYKTAGFDQEQYDYVGWYENEKKEIVYIYNPAEYNITGDEEKGYKVTVNNVEYPLWEYAPIEFTDSLFGKEAAEGETTTNSGTVLNDYNMFYASLPTGKYSFRAYGYNVETSTYNVYLGGHSLNLPTETNVDGGAGGGTNIYLRMHSVYTNSKKVDSTYFGENDYYAEVVMPVMGGKIHSGTPYRNGNNYCFPFMMYAAGNASLYNIYAFPYDTDLYCFNQSINNTTSAGYTVQNKTITISTAMDLTVNVPNEAEFGLYFQYNNFNTKLVEAYSKNINEESGITTYCYKIPKSNSNYTWRLTDPSGQYVTKAGWLSSLTKAKTLDLSFVAGDAADKKLHGFDHLGSTTIKRDEADIHAFLDDSGFMSTTETKRIRAYRLWQIINSDTSNIMIEPEFHTQLLQGNEKDIQKTNGGNAVGNWIDVTPSTTDIVAVNYDAIDIYETNMEYGSHGGLYPATAPERTNVFVITNEAAGTADAVIKYNSNGTASSRGENWDYNYDTWFYNNLDETPTLDFTVTGKNDVKVSYAVVTTTKDMVSTLSDWSESIVDENGYYHADLLKFRNHGFQGGTVIIKMTDETGTSYRLVRVSDVIVKLENASYPEEKIMAGHDVKITFEGLYRGFDKYSGIFNPTTLYMYYTADDGCEVKGTLGQYTRMNQIGLEVTIPKDFVVPENQESASYTLSNGYNYGSMYSAANPFDYLYENMTDSGVGTNFNAVTVNFCMNALPQIAIDVYKTTYVNVDFNVTDGKTELRDYMVSVTDAEGHDYKAKEDGMFALPYGTFTYVASLDGYALNGGTFTITPDLAESLKDEILTKQIVLTEGDSTVWNGFEIKPVQNENGVYQISTGAELGWLAKEVNNGNQTISAVLTKDIDLSNYPWTPIGTYKNKIDVFKGSLDGQGHTIKNLKVIAEGTYHGLFGYVLGTDTHVVSIKNLIVQGNISGNNEATSYINYIGGLIGYAKYVSVENVKTDIAIEMTGKWQYVGGIIGSSSSGTITNCCNYGNVSAGQYVGGIAGDSSKGNITACYNKGDITTSQNYYAGGIAGRIANAEDTVKNCFSIGCIHATGTNNIGSAIGYISKEDVVINAIYALDTAYTLLTGKSSKQQKNMTALTADEIAAVEFVTTMNNGLDNKAFKEGIDHPILSWESDAVYHTITFPETDGCKVIGDHKVKNTNNYTFTVEIAVGYKANENFAVKVNGEVITPNEDEKYTITNVTSDLVITVEGITKIICEPVSVYFSVSHDADYVSGKDNDQVVALEQVNVPYFDLALYGMEDYYFSSASYGDDGDGLPGSQLGSGTAAGAYGKITLLHLYLYATEIYYCGVDPEDAGKGYLYNENLLGTDALDYEGSVGSIYFKKFWGMDENLNYYLNYEYPLASEGWGATADQILLKNGDVITVGHFSDWSFYTDPSSVFNYFKSDDKIVTTTATRGEKINLSVYLAGADESGKYTTGHTPVTSQPEVYYTPISEVDTGDVTCWTSLGNADENGNIIIDTRTMKAGEYIIAISGQYGTSENLTKSICSAPGAIRLTVEEPDILLGDVNEDGEIDTVDANMVIACYYEKIILTDDQLLLADVNVDGEIDTTDANAMISYYYGQ